MNFELMNDAEFLSVEGGMIKLAAPAASNFFIDTCSGRREVSAPFYHTIVEGDFILRCMLRPNLRSTYDAGCLLVHDGDERWIKFALENTDLGYPSLVTVVTDGFSDDCNGERLESGSAVLQIARKGDSWCLHHSQDGVMWKMARYFRLEMGKSVRAGIASQSPLGNGCTTVFNGLEILENSYINIRKPE